MSDLAAIYRFPNKSAGKDKPPSRSSKGSQRSAASVSKVQPWIDHSQDTLELISTYQSPKEPKKFLRMLSREKDVKVFEPAPVGLANNSFEPKEGLNVLDNQGFTILHRAVRENDTKTVTYLLNSGASVDLVAEEDGCTALHTAVRYQSTEIVKLLLERGADPAKLDNYQFTPLHIAARRGLTEVARILLKDPRVDVNISSARKSTPFHMACVNGDRALCELLLRNGADIFAKTTGFYTSLMLAAVRGNEEACKLLVQTASKTSASLKEFLDQKDSDGTSALHHSCFHGHDGIVDLLLQHGADFEAPSGSSCASPLHIAARNGHLTVAELLVLYGAVVESRDSRLATPLHYATLFDHSEIAEFLLDNGADLEAKATMGVTPILIAVIRGAQRSADVLIHRGANVMATDYSLNNCLHLAVKYEWPELVKRLLEITQDKLLKQTNKDLKTAIHLAAALENSTILSILLQEEDLLTQRDIEEMTPLHIAAEKGSLQCVEEMSKCKAFSKVLNDREIRGMTPLHLAASNKHTYTCKLLISKGADATAKDGFNFTPLHWAVKSGSLKTTHVLFDPLLPSTLEEKDGNHNTPLHVACRNGRLDILKFLLDQDANVTARNDRNMTCLDEAIEWGSTEVAKVLVKHKRWKDVLRFCPYDEAYPMEKLIQKLPEVAEVVLDRCLSYSQLPPSHQDFSVKFDLTPLEVHEPGKPTFFAPACMALYNRERLLNHSVTQALLRWKWLILGKLLSNFNLLMFTIFVILYSILVVTERDKIRLSAGGIRSSLNEESQSEGNISSVIPFLIFIFVVVQCVKELIQLVWLRLSYIKDPSNLLDWIMVVFVVAFILPYFSNTDVYGDRVEFQWTAGILGLLLAYINLTLSLRRIGGIGLHVMMYMEVLSTIFKVMLIFSSILVGFALAFYVLLTEEDNFLSVWMAFLKTNVMLVGELDYSDIFVENFAQNNTVPSTNVAYVPLPQLTGVLLVIFAFMISVGLMNLLVGLAVGDIGAIQKTASLRTLVDQALLVERMQRSYPDFIIRRIFKSSWEFKPNQNPFLKRLAFAGMDITDQEFMNGLLKQNSVQETENSIDDVYAWDRLRMERQEESIKKLQATVDSQSRLLRAIADKLQITE